MNTKRTNPFSAKLDNSESTLPPQKKAPIDLGNLSKSDGRTKGRMPINGRAVIYEMNGKVLSKAALRNLSPGGIGFEIFKVNIKDGSIVMVEFEGTGIGVKALSCKVQWVAPIEGHPKQHCMIGLKFHNVSPTTQARLEKFFIDMSKDVLANG